MLSQVGSITDNGVQQFGIACGSSFGCSNGQGLPVWPNIVNVPHLWVAFLHSRRFACSAKIC
jgi:hypothetical protein